MSGSALERLFNNVEADKVTSKPTFEEQLLEEDDDNDALFIEGMSESSSNALMAKLAEVQEPVKPRIEKVIYEEPKVESVVTDTEDIPLNIDIKTGEVLFNNVEEEDDSLDIDRPVEKPITNEEMLEINKNQEDDVADDLVQVTKSKRGRKPKVKQDQTEMENTNMDKQFNNVPMGGTIMHVLGVTMLKDMLKANYTFREFGVNDTALIIKSILSKLEGD